MNNASFWPILKELHKGTFVDLTHTFDAEIPHFEPANTMQVKDVKTHEKEGIWVQTFFFEGQWGTHVDAPAHFFKGLRTLDEIPPKEMVLPLVVIDIHDKVQKNQDYAVSMEDVGDWEKKFGEIPEGAFVALRTDWSQRWPDHAAMHNRDVSGTPRSPGWSLSVLKYLYETRKILASGHETIDPDPGIFAHATRWECESYILSQNHYQIELMTNLHLCSLSGAIVICSFPKPKNSSGFPARVFAICPKK